MPPIPQTLHNLHFEEERLRLWTYQTIEENKDLSDHLSMMEAAMEIADVLRQNYEETEEGIAVAYLAIRTHNHLATAWKLCAVGYYQASMLVLRDLIEVCELVDFFHADRTQILKWARADRKQLLDEFRPSKIRKALDASSKHQPSGRNEIYSLFSNLAAHPTLHGMIMLRPGRGMPAKTGPFTSPGMLRACLEEIGRLSVQLGFSFGVFLDTSIDSCSFASFHFLNLVMDYSSAYLGKTFSEEQRTDLRKAFSINNGRGV